MIICSTVVTQEDAQRKRDRRAPSLYRDSYLPIAGGRLFRGIDYQFFHADVQALSQALKNIGSWHTVLFFNSLNGDSRDPRLFRQSLYRHTTTRTPVFQRNSQVFFVFHETSPGYNRPLSSNSKTILKESQHEYKTILTYSLLFYYPIANLLLLCYNPISNTEVTESMVTSMQQDQEQDIYFLKDPRDKQIRYVGRSSDPTRRLKEHIPSGCAGNEKKKWLRELRDLGLTPELEVIDHAGTTKDAATKETMWIHHYTQQGSILLNSVCVQQREWDKFMEERAEAVRKEYGQQNQSIERYFKPVKCPCCLGPMKSVENAYHLVCKCEAPHLKCAFCNKCILHCYCKNKGE